MTNDWYVIQTVPQRLKAALARLEMAKGPNGEKAEVFCPMFKDRQGKEYKREVTVPLFSRYVFARCDIASLWIHITSSVTDRAIIGPLKTAGQFDTVPDALIQEIREREDEDGLIKMYPDLEVGARVKIVDGDYDGMTGIYDRKLSGEQRVCILLDTANCIKYYVPLDRAQVVPLTLH